MFEENSIIDRILSGDHAAFKGLVDRYQNRVYQYAYRFLGDADDAAEATRDVFMRMYQNIDTADGDLSLAVWVYRITTGVCADMQKRRRISWNAHRDTEAEKLEECVGQQMLRLPRQQREVLILRDLSELSMEEIGAVLDLEHGVVQARLANARRNLRDALVTAGQMDSDEQIHWRGMNNKVEQIYRELASQYVDGNIAEEDKKRLLNHIQECKFCNAYLEDLTRLGRALAHMEQSNAPDWLESSIFRGVQELNERKATSRRHRVNAPLLMLLVLAIAVLLLIVSGVLGGLFVNSEDVSAELGVGELYRAGSTEPEQAVNHHLRIPETVSSNSYAFVIAATGGTELPVLSSSAQLLASDRNTEYYAVDNDVGMMQKLAEALESLGYTIEAFQNQELVINSESSQGLFIIIWGK